MNYTKKIVGGTGILFFMGGLSSLFAYFIRMFLARNLDPTNYGLFYSVFTFIMFFLFFRNLGLGNALVKYIPEFQIKKKLNHIKTAIFSVFTFQLLSSMLFGAVFFFLADFLSVHYFKNESAAILLKLFVFYVVMSILFLIPKNVLQGFQRITLFSLIEPLKLIIVFLLILFFFNRGAGVFSGVIAYVLVCPILFFILISPTLRTFNIFRYKIENFGPITRKLIFFGLPVLVTSVGGRVISYIDTLILTYFRPLAEVGIYNVILPSAMIIVTVAASASSVIFPMSSELWIKKDRKRLHDGIRLMHKYAFVIIVPIIFTGFAFSNLFIHLFFGGEYTSGSLALQILLVGVLFYIVASINNSIISGIGKPETVTKIIFAAGLLNIALNIVLIPTYGINGAAIATSVSYLLTLFLSTHRLTKYVEIDFPLKEWLKSIFSAIFFVSGVFLIKESLNINPWFELVISVSVAGLIYMAVIYFLRIVDLKEIKYYVKLLR